MKLRCVIGSLRLHDGTDYSRGDVFTLDDSESVQTLLASGYIVEVERKKVIKGKRRVKDKNGKNDKLRAGQGKVGASRLR